METTLPIPREMVNFLLVTVFSLLIGLSQRHLHSLSREPDHTFGTDRTFTFIGILGYILFILDPGTGLFFAGGGLVLTIVMAISYYFHIRDFKDYGATTILIALIGYCIGPLIVTQPLWMVLLIVVTVLIMTEMKGTFATLSRKFDRYEFITLAKFLVIAGVILPVLPDRVIPLLDLTPYRIWLAVVVISSISYFSYLLRKFVFPNASILLAGILGGLYSSTAATIILARKSRSDPDNIQQYVAAIIFATAVMYLRILVLIAIFSSTLFESVWPWFLGLSALSALAGLAVLFFHNRSTATADRTLRGDRNPLEFKVALIFTALFVVFTLLTRATLDRFGTPGLSVLSYLVGLTDIDPFLINLFQGRFNVGQEAIMAATFQAIISNNFLKAAYALFSAPLKAAWFVVPAFLFIIACTIVVLLLV